MRRGLRWRLLAMAMLPLMAAAAWAQPSWPTRPIELVVPLAAGGGADAVARAVASGLSTRLGQPVVVENRPGAGGNIGNEWVVKAAPDGYTVLFGVTAVAINPSLMRVRHDPLVDLQPVVQLSRVHLALFARKDLSANTPREVLELVRARPGQVSCASTGGATQLGCALLQSTAASPMIQVPYKGPVAAFTDLSSGVVDLLVDTPIAGQAFVESGRVKAIGTSAPQRQQTPSGELRSLSEAMPEYVLPGWHALFVPAATPPDIVERLNREVNAVLRNPDLVRLMQQSGLEVVGGPAQVMQERLREDHARYRRIAREAGIQPQ